MITSQYNNKDESVAGSDALAWAPVHVDTLSSQLIQQIRDSFLTGRLKTGDYLGSERSLAEQFGVSRVAIRDALRSLVAIGLIEVRKGKSGGAWVASGSIEHYADLLSIQLKMMEVTELEMVEAQIAIGIQATEYAVMHASELDLQGLESLHEQLRAARGTADFTRLALDFHVAVVSASKNRALIAQFLAIRQILQSNYGSAVRPDRAERTLAFVENLLVHFRSRNAQAAREVMADRLSYIRESMLKRSSPYWNDRV